MAVICSLHQPQTLMMFLFLFSFFSFKTGEYFSSVTDCETSKILVPHRMTNTKRRIELELVSMIRSLRLKNFLQFAHGIRYIFAHFLSYRYFYSSLWIWYSLKRSYRKLFCDCILLQNEWIWNLISTSILEGLDTFPENSPKHQNWLY